jgi:hypothetical protein
MSDHDYNAQQALGLLMLKVRSRDVLLADSIQEAIDEGKDISETEPPRDRRQKPRSYRKTVPFTHEEALEVAIRALKAHFVEVPLFINSAVADFTYSAIGIPQQKQAVPLIGIDEPEIVVEQAQGEPKEIDMELQPETRLSGAELTPLRLKPISVDRIEEQKENLRRLSDMFEFDERNPDGNAQRP